VIDDLLHRNRGPVEGQEKLNLKTHRP